MGAQRFIERLTMSLSAWAARPLASGALLSLVGKRGRSSVGVGCPSFGGQRADSDESRRLLAELVTGLNRTLPAKLVEVISVAVRIQAARLAAKANVGVPFAGLCRAAVVALGSVRKSEFRGLA